MQRSTASAVSRFFIDLPTHHKTKEEAPSLLNRLGFRCVRNLCNRVFDRKTETAGKIKLSVTRKNVWEFLGLGRVRYGLQRLANIEKSGNYLFFLNTATHPLPFHPRAVPLRREKLRSSTKNGKQKGSVYNNFSLVSVFCQADDDSDNNNDRRRVISLETALKRCRISEEKFLEKAIRFHKYFMLDGNPNNMATWGCDDVPKSALLRKMPK